ncbi:MAG: 50S ribosomal protein L23 [Clostridia bacterium]|nr:50S ribosomal protein L23 [Clostridia bacterium]
MKLAQEIILKPIITEKSMAGAEAKKSTCKVAKDATKVDIARAIEEIYGVEVVKVNTVNVRGKKRRYGRFEGTTPSSKKATVTLSAKSKSIEFFEGMM